MGSGGRSRRTKYTVAVDLAVLLLILFTLFILRPDETMASSPRLDGRGNPQALPAVTENQAFCGVLSLHLLLPLLRRNALMRSGAAGLVIWLMKRDICTKMLLCPRPKCETLTEIYSFASSNHLISYLNGSSFCSFTLSIQLVWRLRGYALSVLL